MWCARGALSCAPVAVEGTSPIVSLMCPLLGLLANSLDCLADPSECAWAKPAKEDPTSNPRDPKTIDQSQVQKTAMRRHRAMLPVLLEHAHFA